MKNVTALCKYIWECVVEALFPPSRIEMELRSLTPESAMEILPKAPKCPMTGMTAAFHYKDELVAEMIWHIKYKKSANAARIGAHAIMHVIEDKMDDSRFTGNLLLIPIPITKNRRRMRGYNQCELLLNELRDMTRVESRMTASGYGRDKVAARALETLWRNTSFDYKLLERKSDRGKQAFKSKSERLTGSKGIFSVNDSALRTYAGFEDDVFFVIIDDVITTGSTMREAIVTLKNSSLKNVVGISVAH